MLAPASSNIGSPERCGCESRQMWRLPSSRRLAGRDFNDRLQHATQSFVGNPSVVTDVTFVECANRRFCSRLHIPNDDLVGFCRAISNRPPPSSTVSGVHHPLTIRRPARHRDIWSRHELISSRNLAYFDKVDNISAGTNRDAFSGRRPGWFGAYTYITRDSCPQV